MQRIVSSYVDAGSRPMNFRDPVVSVSVEVTVFVTVPAFPGMLGIRTQLFMHTWQVLYQLIHLTIFVIFIFKKSYGPEMDDGGACL